MVAETNIVSQYTTLETTSAISIAGIGNIYASEILHICNISPFRDIRDLTMENMEALAFAIPEVLNRAYKNGGSSHRFFWCEAG